jgi:thiamine biosynthesis protein ThiI
MNKNRALALISGGIDSPVASYRMITEGWDLDFVFFFTKPFVRDEEKELVLNCVKQLKTATGEKEFKLFIVPSSESHIALITKCPPEFRHIVLRRLMFRIAAALAKKNKCSALVTGENLGQVSSQTLQNLVAISDASDVPILRPLLGFDKTETTRISEKIGTFVHSKCHKDCGLGVVSNPVTAVKRDELAKVEKKLPIAKLVQQALKRIETMTL